MDIHAFIKTIKLDEQQRVLISVQEFLEPQLATPENKKMIKDTLMQILGPDFVQLEVGKNVCRVTVAPGTEQAAVSKIEQGIKSALEMAMSFMNESPEETLKN